MKKVFLGLLFHLSAINGANILGIYPRPAISHFSFSEGIMRSLHSAGHNVTFLNPFLETQTAENFTVINSRLDRDIHVGKAAMDCFTEMYGYQMQRIMIEMEEQLCHDVMKIKQIQDALSTTDKRFDLILTEMLYMYECFLIVADILDVPVIVTIPVQMPPLSWVAEPAVQNPHNPAVIPHFRTSFGRSMTFPQRLMNTLTTAIMDVYSLPMISSKLIEFKRQHFPQDIGAVKTRAPSLMFVNSHPIMYPRPMVPNSIEIAGIHLKPVKPLPRNLQKFIDEAEHGVILISFGSVLNGSSMPMKIKSAFAEALASVPQRVIWKFETTISGISDNVLLSSWVPQRDILEHKNVKAFISHCGIAGVIEAIHSGTPVIATPLIGDQRTSAALLEELGVAVHLDLMTATKDTLLGLIDCIINDTRYYDKMQEISRIFRDRPMSPEETVVYWTNYVLRHDGAGHLRTAAADMPFYQYLLLDIIFFVGTTVIVILLALYFLLKKMYSVLHQKLLHLPTAKKQQ